MGFVCNVIIYFKLGIDPTISHIQSLSPEYGSKFAHL